MTEEVLGGHILWAYVVVRPWKTVPTQAVVWNALGVAVHAFAILSTWSVAWLWALNLQVQPWDHFSGLSCPLSSHKVFLSYSIQGGSFFLQLKMTWPNGHTQICNGTPLANKGSRKLLNKGILILTWAWYWGGLQGSGGLSELFWCLRQNSWSKKWLQLKHRITSTLTKQLNKWQSRWGSSRSIAFLSLLEMPPSWVSCWRANPSEKAYFFIVSCVADFSWHSSGLSSWEGGSAGSQEVEGGKTLNHFMYFSRSGSVSVGNPHGFERN